MISPSPDGKFIAISYTGDKFVHILDASTKEMLLELDATAPREGVTGGAIHTGSWYAGSTYFIMVDMTGTVDGIAGGALHKFSLDLGGNSTYQYMESLGMGSSAAGRGTTGTKPIAMGSNHQKFASGRFSHLYMVTDAKGAGSIVNVDSMTVVADIPLADFGNCTSGGIWVEPHPTDESMVLAQYGAQNAEHCGEGCVDGPNYNPECLYKVSLDSKSITEIVHLPPGADDAHGLQFCTATDGTLFIVNTNRISATLDIVNYETGEIVVASLKLNDLLPGSAKVLQPDVIYSSGNHIYIAGRGSVPLTAVKPMHKNPEAIAGVYSFTISSNCDSVTFNEGVDVALAATVASNVEGNDFHGISGHGDEVWGIDQSATGSVKTSNVYSGCTVEDR